MYLLLSIVVGVLLAMILIKMGPLVGGILAFGIFAGCIFRGLYLLSEIQKSVVPAKQKVKPKDVLQKYLEERDN
ncbi:hypothetical protein AEA09_10425 [Lysinibacillus contaminans]|uniref:ATP-dependent Lon protease n=1 Tax=Lysinibacillus contaminans TaxID=1293441 RepID=A0ABR5K2C2_9BACI|nr:hypothetical protein [Lysinibacillus contaminans]KOS68918.1 hypothetical protein AEA09_10425 [Lysinibacillus contaminans]